jgi:FixJ family two-component response regulator
VLDLQMPDVSGMEVQRALKLAGAQFPIIVITAHDAPSMREESMGLGASAYLTKPLDIRTLLDAVNQAVEPPN